MSTDSERDTFRKLAAAFEKEHSDIHVSLHFPGNDYENMMRVRMAANDLPDLFDTHGWGKIRYGEYTADLRDMKWTQDLDPNLNSILKNKSGKVYAYPINQAKDGLAYNRNILDRYGIAPPETMDDFIKALRTIKEKSKEALFPSGLPDMTKAHSPNITTNSLHLFSSQTLPIMKKTAHQRHFSME